MKHSPPGQLAIPRLSLSSPGVIIVGADEGVGKSVIACLVADQLARRGIKVGPFKPIATGCQRAREGLISRDAEMLAAAARFDPEVGTLRTVNPVALKYKLPPSLALIKSTQSLTQEQDYASIGRALKHLDSCDVLVVEAPGGVMTPLDHKHNTLDLLRTLDFPVLVVTQPFARMFNLTAEACMIIRRMNLRLAGLIINGYDPDHPDSGMQDVVQHMGRHCRADIVAVVPRREPFNAIHIDPDLQAAVDVADIYRLCLPARWQ